MRPVISSQKLLSLALLSSIICVTALAAQDTRPAPDADLASVLPSLALVLTADGSGRFSVTSAGLIVRSDGIVLTTHRSVMGAKQVQVRLSNGEVYDRVELIAQDERRNVAALRIAASSLPEIATAALTELKPGDPVRVIYSSSAQGWVVSAGVFEGTRMADSVPSAGTGYRLLSFSAEIPTDSRGGTVVDNQGRAIGILLNARDTEGAILAVPLESVAGLTSTPGGSVLGGANSAPLPASTPRPAEVGQGALAAKAAAAPKDPLEILRSFQTYYIKSGTIFLHRDVMQKALQERPEFVAWNLKPVDDPGSADVTVEITLPFLSWEWNYKMVHRATGQLLGTGKVKALEQHQAAPLLVTEITKKIQSAGRVPVNLGAVAAQPARAQARLKKWHVKGWAGPFQGKDLTLSIGRESIFVSEQSAQTLEILTRSVLSAYHYHFATESFEKRQRIQSWEHGWDEACNWTAGSDGLCLALLGAPIWLIGGAILRAGGTSSDLVVVRWQDDQAVNELAFRVGTSEWKDILRDLQAAIPNDQSQVTADTQHLRKEFETAKQRDLKISLESAANVGRWPPLGPGDYRIVVVERTDARAEVFFFSLPDAQFDRPRAVAAAHLRKVSPSATPPTVTFREKDGVRLIDEIRADDVLLRFD